MNFLNSSPTFRLLNSSTLVAFSGALRLHIAFLFAGIETKIPVYLSIGLVIYSVYTLDRALDSEEDVINRSELTGANRNIAIFTSIIAFFAGALIFAGEKIYFASFFPFVVGYLYSKGIKAGKFQIKLKGGMGVKNIVIGMTWGGTIASIVAQWSENIFTDFSIFLFFFMKLFINSVLYDFKDIQGDTSAGIRTLPVYFGKDIVRKILFELSLILHCFMILAFWIGFIRLEPIILSYSFIVMIISIYYISAFEAHGHGIRKYSREVLIDAESTIALVLRSIIIFQFL